MSLTYSKETIFHKFFMKVYWISICMKRNTSRIEFQTLPMLIGKHNESHGLYLKIVIQRWKLEAESQLPKDCIFDKTSYSASNVGSPVAVADGLVESQSCSTGTQDAASTAGAPKSGWYGITKEANEWMNEWISAFDSRPFFSSYK